MKKSKRLIKALIVMLSLVLTVSLLSSCGILTVLLLQNTYLSSELYFSDVKYSRPDFDKIENKINSTIELIKNKSSVSRIRTSLSSVYRLYNEASTNYSVAEIYYYNNASDEKYAEEKKYCSEKFAELDTKLTELYSVIIENGYEASLLSDWTEYDFELQKINEKMQDSEYSTLIAERTALENEYMQLLADDIFIGRFNGKKYTINEAVDAYDNGTLDYETYYKIVEIYYDILATKAAPIYLRMVEIDKTISQKADIENYADYCYKYKYAREYTHSDVEKVYSYVKKTIKPLYKRVSNLLDYDKVQAALSSKDEPLKEYNDRFSSYFAEVSPDMAKAYEYIKEFDLYSFGNDENMQNAGFTTYLSSYGVPYIYLYTYDDLTDVSSFVHEFGHFYSYYYNNYESDSVLDVCEIQSQANEWLFVEYLDLSDSVLDAYVLYLMQESLSNILLGCLFDEFQYYTYMNDLSTQGELTAVFQKLLVQYGLSDFYDENIWAVVHHNFVLPFYYISYAISEVPSIEIYGIALKDRERAIKIYNDVINMKGYRTLTEVLEDNSLSSPFEEAVYYDIEKIVQKIIVGKNLTSDYKE